MERTQTHISAWFWSRHSSKVPLEVRLGLPIIDTAILGEPYALFVDTDCPIPGHFAAHNIVINLTLCELLRLLTAMRLRLTSAIAPRKVETGLATLQYTRPPGVPAPASVSPVDLQGRTQLNKLLRLRQQQPRRV